MQNYGLFYASQPRAAGLRLDRFMSAPVKDLKALPGAEAALAAASAWWSTSIIRIEPGTIEIRGYPIQQLIGEVRFPR